MEEEYMEMQDPSMGDMNRSGDGVDVSDMKDYNEGLYEENYEDEDGTNNFRISNRGRGSFRSRGRGPPMGWMNGPPMRFRGRGYGPGGPPMRGRGFFRGRGGPRFGPNGGPPNFDNNWGPMGPPPPGMMSGPPPFGPPPGMMPPGGPMGPPPNMMGQPPPFGGPPGIPPPNMPTPEFWVEAKTDEGKAYYYHARTRETTWTRPQETPNLKVISQGEVEAMVAAGQVTNITVPPQTLAALNSGMPGPMGGPPMGMMPNGMMGGMMPPQNNQQQGGGMPPYMGQPPMWVKEGGQYDVNKEKPDEVDQEVEEMPPGETISLMQNSNGNMGGGYPVAPTGYNAGGPFQQAGSQQQQPPQQQQQQQQQGGYPGGGQGGPGPANAGYGSWGGWGGGWPPQMVSQPPPNMASQQMGENGGQSQMNTLPNDMQQQPQQPLLGNNGNQMPSQSQQQHQPTHNLGPFPMKPLKQGKHTTISPELYAKASEWTSHKSPDGRFYYYNSARKESVWEKPKVLKEYEDLELKIAIENGERKIETIVIDDKPDEVDLMEAEEAAKAEIERQAAAELAEEKAREAAAEQERLEREKAEKEKQEKEASQKEKAKPDKRLPVSTIAISGTPWCVVWTGDGRVFFHNPTALSSVWERPAQLIGRADVDKAVSTPPAMLAEAMRKENKATVGTTATGDGGNDSKSNGDLKRSVDPSESDSDAEPPKKAKPDDNKKLGGTIDAGKEAAIEAEVRAARERGVVPHEQRLKSFQQMLHEKEVSAFSTWEKELHKIVFDPRYLMLNSKERRQVFDQYVRERAEEERKEKKSRLQQKKIAFKHLLDEAKLHSKSSYTEFSAKHGRDERFKAIEKPRDRENYFNEHITDVRKREKEEKEKKREQAKMDFIALLREKAIDRHTRWVEVKKKIDSDPRYKAVEASSLKEDYFREYCKMVKEGKKKDKEGKEKDRSKKEKKDKDRDKESKREKKKEKAEKETQPEATREGAEVTEPTVEEIAAAKEREARAQASIKEREREVQRALATSLRDRDKEREYHKRDEAVQHFNALLADLVRNPDLAWRDAKKQLKKDHRYSLAELLSKDDKERLFSQHTSALGTKRRDKLRALLNDLAVSCTSQWRDVKEQLGQDPAAPTYTSSSQMEREFREYQRDKQSTAKTALRQLLLETRAISHKTFASVKDNANAMQQLHDGLKQDARYLALDHITEERDQIIMSYLEEMEKKGPPPPPTATEPTRRTKQ